MLTLTRAINDSMCPCSALAVQVFSIFDSAGASDSEHIDEKLSTSCARWATACMRAVCSKRAIRDAALAPVVVCPTVRTVSAPRRGTGTMFFVSPVHLHVRL